MLTKINLYFQIRKFYKMFGTELGSNFITKLSDITNDNLYDVLFDINEVLDANADCFYEEAYEMDAWLNKLQSKITDFRDGKDPIKKAIKTTLMVLVVAFIGWGVLSTAEILTKNLSDYNLFAVIVNERKSYGTYYADGTITTIDGHIWDYHKTDLEDGTPIKVYFDHNGTDDVTDDSITRIKEVQ